MRVAFLAPANSVHTVRWTNGLAGRGLDVHLISAHAPLAGIDRAVTVHRLALDAPWAYLLAFRQLRRCLAAIRPDLLNAHYASGYGLLARLAGFHPALLSVWGADVYDFPHVSALHHQVIRRNLGWADAVASTSECMARQARAVGAPRKVFVTPFGVDEDIFLPGRTGDSTIVVGTVKTLAPKYGIDVLIRAFARVRNCVRTTTPLRLEITGGGPEEAALKALAQSLGLADCVLFHGAVRHDRVPEMLRRLDVFVALSRDDSESFGVAVVEAAACGLPVVVSDAEGLVEVTRNGETGLVVPRNDPDAAADAIVRLVEDSRLRESYGRAGRAHVLRHYCWRRSLDLMIAAYEEVFAAAGGRAR